MEEADTIVIREAEYRDIDDMADLLYDLFSIEKDFTVDPRKQEAGLKILLDDDGRRQMLVAVEGDDVVGMVTAQKLVSTSEGSMVALIEDLVVKKEYRRKGIATQLIDEILQWCEREGLIRVQLLTDKNNTIALKFYEKQEFIRTNLICLRIKL